MKELCFLFFMSTLGLFGCNSPKEPVTDPVVVEQPVGEHSDYTEIMSQTKTTVTLRFINFKEESHVAEIWWNDSYQGFFDVRKKFVMPRKEGSSKLKFQLYDKATEKLGSERTVWLNVPPLNLPNKTKEKSYGY